MSNRVIFKFEKRQGTLSFQGCPTGIDIPNSQKLNVYLRLFIGGR